MMPLEEIATRLVLLQRWSDRTGTRTSSTQSRLVRELSPEQLNTVLALVMSELRPLHEQLPEVLKGGAK